MTYLTRTDYAKSKNWSRQYVGKLVQQGRLVLTDDGLVDVDASEQYLAMTSDPGRRNTNAAAIPIVSTQASPQPVPMSSPIISPGYQQAKARLALAQAELTETNLRKANGTLVEVDVVDGAAFAAGRMIRDQILALPAQLAPELSAMTDSWQVERTLASALRRVLDDAAAMVAAEFEHAIHSQS
ncbi:hypothetical protein H4C81_09820 [Pseudomonas monteilii]|uniref:hypothetical protein n=1 Tax=Pseudomonas monteilii TaxID=76759 RepID=UPI0006D964CB|nr:hypothetical protein [Pseudomonas monteilii]KPM60205.1 hypothetical protein HB4184_22105 [Pseudomonas putida]MBA6089196.1 hypothetical protein [Pseudomonas monteilii]